MPITATPAVAPVVSPPCCDGPVIAPELAAVPCPSGGSPAPVSQQYGQPIWSRLRSITAPAKRDFVLSWQFHVPEGNPLDFTDCAGSDSSSSSGLISRLQWREWFDRCEKAREAIGDLETASGLATLQIPAVAIRQPGIYAAEITAEDANGIVLATNQFLLVIERGVGADQGPPTLAELRLHLRDSHPAESRLLDSRRFDDAEIAACFTRPVQEWNDTPPPVRRFTTRNFPYRFYWMEAAMGYLFQMASEQYRANQLSYSAAGVTIDDQNKEVNYQRASMQCLQVWRDFLRKQKIALNLEGCYGGIGSSYGRGGCW